VDEILESLKEAREQARVAYEFVPGPYTHAAFMAASKALKILTDELRRAG
jgi:hypothetical protein